MKICIFCSFALDIISKVQTADEVIIDTSNGDWRIPNNRDDALSIGTFPHIDGTPNTVMEDDEEEEEMLAHRVNKRTREMILNTDALDLTNDNSQIDVMVPNSLDKRRTAPLLAGSSISSAIVID